MSALNDFASVAHRHCVRLDHGVSARAEAQCVTRCRKSAAHVVPKGNPLRVFTAATGDGSRPPDSGCSSATAASAGFGDRVAAAGEGEADATELGDGARSTDALNGSKW